MLISGLRDLYLSFNALFQFSEVHFSSSSVSVLDMFFILSELSAVIDAYSVIVCLLVELKQKHSKM